MKVWGYKVHIILITCVVIIAVGFGANKFVYGRHVTETLERDFAALPGVVAAQLHDRDQKTVVSLRVENVADFPSLYKQASEMANARLGRDAADVLIDDDRNDDLKAAYERIHLALYEGAATGGFIRMEQHVREVLHDDSTRSDPEADASAIEYKISVDDDAVYIELVGRGGQLYERIPRSHGTAAGILGGMLP